MIYGQAPSGVRVRRGFADSSFGQLHYRVAGDGPPLVLLHNTWLSSKMYLGILPMLTPEFTVYCIDTLGQGDSDPAPDDQLEIEDFARALLEAIDDLGLNRPSIAGHHTGGVIAAEAALQAPEKIHRIVLSGIPFWRNPANRLGNEHDRFFADWAPEEDGSHLQEIWEAHSGVKRYGIESTIEMLMDYMKPGPRTSIALRALFRWDSNNKLPLIQVPTLVLCSETDGFVRRIADVAELIPGSTLKIVGGGIHHPLHEPYAFADEVAAFCAPARD